MKTRNLLAPAAFALALSLTACDSYKPIAPTTEIQSGDKTCRIESFTLKLANGGEIRGDVYDYDRSIDIGWNTANHRFLKDATATYTLSKGATIAPDPAVAMDYSSPVEYTVTAPDGVTKRVYKTKPVEKTVATKLNVTALAHKTGDDAGSATVSYGQIGVSGSDVVVGTKVYNGKTLELLGDLDVTGMTGKLAWLTNDEAGHLVGAFTPEGKRGATPTELVIWKDGWDKASTLIANSGAPWSWFLSVSGNLVEGAGLLTAEIWNTAEGKHHGMKFINGKWTYFQVQTNKPSNNPEWSHQQVSACTGDPFGTWFLYDGYTEGNTVFTWNNWSDPTSLPLNQLKNVVTYGGPGGWGNLPGGSVRAFTWGGKPYAIALTRTWESTIFTIVDGEGKKTHSELILYGSGNGYSPTAAYIYNPDEGVGYIYIHIPQDSKMPNQPQAVLAWRLEETEI